MERCRYISIASTQAWLPNYVVQTFSFLLVLWYKFLCLLILLNFLYLYEIRCNSYLFLVLKRCPCVGVSLCSLHVTSSFGARAESEVGTCCIFPQKVLAATTVMGCRARDAGARVRDT